MRKLERRRWQSGRSSNGLLASPYRQRVSSWREHETYLDILEYAEIRLGILCHKVELELGALDTTQYTLENIIDMAFLLNRQYPTRRTLEYSPISGPVQVLIEPMPA